MQLFFLPLTVAAAILSSTNALSSSSTSIKMVEGHSVHRIASRFRSQLVGKRFTASSPNGRFIDGARAIDGKYLSRMEAVGKNLFAFFNDNCGTASSSNDEDVVVVHVHFGMSGAWAVFITTSSPSESFGSGGEIVGEVEPEVKPTTRLRLEEIITSSQGTSHKICTHLSAMTVALGNYTLYTSKKSTLGEDPLRSDANPDRLYNKIAKSKKSIGQLIMDQSYFAGPGNIYRAEILFLAGVYPTTLGVNLDKVTFDKIWNVTVQLLRRGYDTGSILTVDAKIDPEVAAKGERRYIYNQSRCARCGGKVSSWDMSGRTCYACDGGCQPKQQLIHSEEKSKVVAKVGSDDGVALKSSVKKKAHKQHVPFISHCAPVDIKQRLKDHGPEQLTTAEIRSIMEQMVDDSNTSLPPKSENKSSHVQALRTLLMEKSTAAAATSASHLPPPIVSAEDAAREKAISGENRSVEHVAELSREQALGAISVTPSPKLMKKKGGGKRRSKDDGGEVKKERRSTRRKLLADE